MVHAKLLAMRARVALSLAAAGLLVLALAGQAQAAITVANQNDSGPGSLRETVATAPPGATVVLPAGGAFRVIEILGPADAMFSGVTIRDGNISAGPGEGVGILSVLADLTLRN